MNNDEFCAAKLLLNFFKTDIEIIKETNEKTPDFEIDGEKWELKSPRGNGKNNIRNNLNAAKRQSVNIIFDSRYSKIKQEKIDRELNKYFRKMKRIRRLVVIKKGGCVIELKR